MTRTCPAGVTMATGESGETCTCRPPEGAVLQPEEARAGVTFQDQGHDGVGDAEGVAGHAAVGALVLRLDVNDGDDGAVAAEFDVVCGQDDVNVRPGSKPGDVGGGKAGCTGQMLVVGHLPLQPDGLGAAVDPAPEGRRLPDTHRRAVGLDGDDGALETCGRKWIGQAVTPVSPINRAGNAFGGLKIGRLRSWPPEPDWAFCLQVQLRITFLR